MKKPKKKKIIFSLILDDNLDYNNPLNQGQFDLLIRELECIKKSVIVESSKLEINIDL